MGSYSRSSTLLRTTLFLVIAAIITGTLLFVYQSSKNTSETLKNTVNDTAQVKKPVTAKAETAAPALNYVNN